MSKLTNVPTTWHMCLNVRGFLNSAKKREYKMFEHDDGTNMTYDEARNALFDELAQGHEVIPMGKCDNFDYKTGCKGHPNVEVIA
ncbi:hypothetical protein [Solimicrobium silvestre]|uniref:Uncharacterized protein n=1 Tax=Solimicrobium silvestre TaxID=2099400 RepID=A0A2S9GY27_9BURK|nr:hypothetical protein [Solimicrobium silvestre]PRC92622.1 hypothetical protein S2091_2677 [Solimicrobium silvestre]